MPEPTPPLDLAAIEGRHQPNATPAEWHSHWPYEPICEDDAQTWPCDAAALVARVRALEAEVARLRQAALTMTADTDCTILSLRARLPDGTEVDLPVG